MASLSLKLVVDKEKNRVVFVESNKDFIDILFSFLTLPMGSIIRLLGKNSEVGCMDMLYKSIENLDANYLQTEACKMMLLQPRSASEKQCEDLAINVDDLDPKRIYRCPNWDCFTKTHCLFSTVEGARCPCGQVMDTAFEWAKLKMDEDVFVSGASATFMTSDDLHVTPTSIEATLSLLERLRIKNIDALEEMTVDISKDQILSLLRRLLVSQNPLSDIFLTSNTSIDHEKETEKWKHICTTPVKQECESAKQLATMRVRVFESKSTNKVMYAEAGKEFVDILFSFLTFPLGSIVNLLNKHSLLGCVDNIYQSVEELTLGDDEDCIMTQECKEMLLAPKLASHFGCSNQLLRINEKLPGDTEALGCESCFQVGKVVRPVCSHGIKEVDIKKINPKLPVPGTEHGGGFTKGSIKFMMTNEMFVAPVSPAAIINIAKEQKVSLANLSQREINCGEREVLDLLKACLLSRTALDVFSRMK